MKEQQYTKLCNDTWWEAAVELEVDGYKQTGAKTRLPVFKKKGHADLILVRDLGKLNWHSRER